MGVYACEKVKITVPRGEEGELFQTLQNHEIVEVIPSSQPRELPDVVQEEYDTVNSRIQTLEKVIPVLQTYTSDGGPLEALKDTRLHVSSTSFHEFKDRKEEIVATAADISARIDRLSYLYEQRKTTTDTLSMLEPLKDISLPILDIYRFLAFIPFQVHNERTAPVLNTLYQTFDTVVAEEAKRFEEETVYIAATSKEQGAGVQSKLAEEAHVLSIPEDTRQSLAETYEEIKRRYDTIEHEIHQIHQELESYTESLADFQLMYDVLASERDTLAFQSYLHPGTNGDEQYVLGWVAPERIGELRALVAETVPQSDVEICESEPSRARVTIDNPPIIRSFEVVTRIMGLPKGGSLDPTPTLAIFFTLMFGLGFSEAGYALVLLAASTFLMRLPRVRTSVRKVSVVMFWASLSTLVVGTLFGSWFGLNPQSVSAGDDLLPHMEFLVGMGIIPFLQGLQIMNPLEGILPLIAFIVGLGIVHLLAGTILGAVQAYRKGDREGALLDNLSWSVLLILIVATVLTPVARSLFIGLLIVYGVFMVLASGRTVAGPAKRVANGVFNLYLALIGYLGDTLSYLRLVAIGLATAIIARVIGTLAVLAGAPLVEGGGFSVVIGYLIMAIIFVGGHLFNIALNVLGTYVNVGRLHFVEFFKQFFEGGGEELQPFKRSQTYSKIVYKV